jgi:hypothetical protein
MLELLRQERFLVGHRTKNYNLEAIMFQIEFLASRFKIQSRAAGYLDGTNFARASNGIH